MSRLQDSQTGDTSANRRTFLQQSAVAASALGVLSAPQWAHAAGTNETLKIGLIGCGGRGTDAVVNALTVEPNAKLVAMGDTFADRITGSLDTLKANPAIADRIAVDADHQFTDFDNYKKVIDSGVDVVMLATPPHFRPEQFRYAVEAGKHCFVEKPVAVDAPGVRHVEESCRMAADKGLSVLSGLCWRYEDGVQETMRRILEAKEIGDIIAVESAYNAGTLWHRGDKPEWSRMEYQIRNWLYYTWLSGDHIAEQAIHSLDKTCWLMGDVPPVRATGMGGRQQRTDAKWGNIYDHHTVFFEYASGARVYFTCRQMDGCSTFVDERVLGTTGQAAVNDAKLFKPDGSRQWSFRGPRPSFYNNEQDAFFKSIRSGEPINNGHYMCNSTMVAIMGRMCVYSGKTLTWDECYNSQVRLGPTDYAWGDVPEPPVAMPGSDAKDIV